MLDKNALRAEIVRNGFTQKDIAEILNMSEKTFISRIKKGVFGTDEVEKLISILHIKKPMDIFFANKVT